MMQKSRPQDGIFVCGIRRLRLFRAPKRQNPGALSERPGFWTDCIRSLTITYFHTGNPHYHRRGVVSRSCSGWEGVVPTRYGHQA